MQQITTGYQNTASGDYSLHNITTGFQNAAFGAGALDYYTTGDRNTGVGMFSGRSAASFLQVMIMCMLVIIQAHLTGLVVIILFLVQMQT